jgi:hypothetical protein
MIAPIYIKYQCIADSLCYVLYAGKTHNQQFLGVFRGGKKNFYPQIVICPTTILLRTVVHFSDITREYKPK